MNINARSADTILALLQRFPKENCKLGLFSVFFWCWVICVSFWIENASLLSIPNDTPEQKYSQIDFQGINFHQTNSMGALVSLTASKAIFDSVTGKMDIDQPIVEWQNTASAKIISASSQKGVFYSELTESSLPSAFRYIILSGSAAVQGENSRVDSETMLFDNEKRFFIFPGPFQFKQGKKNILSKGMYYDPFKDKTKLLSELLKVDPELLPLINSIGKTKP